jgi:type IV secretory pathway TrbF-like protein
MKVPGWLTGAKTNGVTPQNGVRPSEAQRARLNDFERALRGEKTWRGVSKALGVPIFALGAAVVVLAARPPQVAVFDREPDGTLHFAGDAQQKVTPDEVTIDSSIVAFVRYMREIPGSDFRLVDRNLDIAHRNMTVQGSPAERDELAYWQAHNPKSRGREMTRLVLARNPAPIVTRKGDSLTWMVTWAEQTKDDRGALGPLLVYNGSVTMQNEPTLSPDGAKALDNPAGVDIYAFNLPEN